MIYPVLSGTLFLFIGIFLLTASIEPVKALEQDNFVDVIINEGVNFDWMSQKPWLCVLNNNLCNYIVKNPNDAGSQNIFNIIDDVVENHAADVNIRMFKFNIDKDTKNAEFAQHEVERLNNELSKTQKKREILKNCQKEETISIEACTTALMQIFMEEKYIKKQATEIATIIRKKNLELSDEFEKISREKDDSSDGSQSAKAIHTPKMTKTPEPTKTSTKTRVPTKTPTHTL